MKCVLSIAGSDPIGGAGLQADIKTITAHGMYAMTAVTAVTVQNTTGVFGVADMSPDIVARQIDAVFDDIRPDSVKIGMISNGDIASAIAAKLVERSASHIVLDPVMVATSKGRLIDPGAIEYLTKCLIPTASIVTPNIPEAEVLSGIEINGRADMERAAQKIAASCDGAILIKGGHLRDSSDDLLWMNGAAEWFAGERIAAQNTHGTGCTLSSAIACGLADGYSISQSVERAKRYITGAISATLDAGHGSRPLDHMWSLRAHV